MRASVDVYAALCSIDAYRELTARGWTADRIEAGWNYTLVLLLLEPAADPTRD